MLILEKSRSVGCRAGRLFFLERPFVVRWPRFGAILKTAPEEGARYEGFHQMSASVSLTTAALDTLHGARVLAPAEAAAKLRDFLESIQTSIPDSPRLADASSALRLLVSQLEKEGAATDDDWQRAIETMLSLANEES
jgi:hypothetical protein